MPIEVRPAHADEFADVGELTYAAYTADRPVSAAYGETLRAAAARAADGLLLVAVDGAALLGTATVAMHGTAYADIALPGEAELRMLAVDVLARGRGVGGLLTEACIERARRAGAHQLVLSTRPWMSPAKRLYERLGFERVPDRDWAAGDAPLLVYRYVL